MAASAESVNEDLSGVPNEFLCPIYKDIMRDPVVAADGFSYERAAIEHWIRQQDPLVFEFTSEYGYLCRTQAKSPITRQPLGNSILKDNISLRKLIRDYLDRGVSRSALAPAAPTEIAQLRQQLEATERYRIRMQQQLEAAEQHRISKLTESQRMSTEIAELRENKKHMQEQLEAAEQHRIHMQEQLEAADKYRMRM
jgi:hypothetical protein